MAATRERPFRIEYTTGPNTPEQRYTLNARTYQQAEREFYAQMAEQNRQGIEVKTVLRVEAVGSTKVTRKTTLKPV